MRETPKGIVRNAFYMPNERKQNLNTCMERERGENTEIFRYKLDEAGRMVLIEMKKQ